MFRSPTLLHKASMLGGHGVPDAGGVRGRAGWLPCPIGRFR